jgi:transcription initiation factor TFIID subunit 15
MGDIPASTKMVSTVILNPKNLDTVTPNQSFNITVKIANMQLGAFTNATSTYYSAPQALNGQGQVIGHTHVTVQDVGNSLNPTEPLDAQKFVFFKGINDAGNGAGTLTTAVTGGLPAGNYRVCTISGASNHQPVLMPVAQRGAQEDCRYFSVANGGGGNAAGGTNNAAAGGNAAGGQGQGKGQGAGKGAGVAASSSAAAATSSQATGGRGGGRGGKGNAGANAGAAATSAAAAASDVASSSAAAAASTTTAAGGQTGGRGGKGRGGNAGANNAGAAATSAAAAASDVASSSAAAAATTAAAAGGRGGKGRGGNAGANNAGAAAASSAAPAATTAAATGHAAGGATNNNAVVSGAIAGVAAPVVADSGDATRPFSVNGDTFVNKAAAVQRACAIQNNGCANAVNSGAAQGVTVSDCNAQETACNAAA